MELAVADAASTNPVSIVRVYEDPGRRRNELRVLVGRLWPRGIAKSTLDYDEWAKDLAPSTALRQWYGHEPALFKEFDRRYRKELAGPVQDEALHRLRIASQRRRLILLTATRDVDHSGAAVLRDVLERAPKVVKRSVS